jgi:hypothetical protein
MASCVTRRGPLFEVHDGHALLIDEVPSHFSDRAELCCIDFTNFFVFVHKRYRGGQGDTGRPEIRSAGPGRGTGASAIAGAGVAILRTAGDLHSDHRDRSNALAGPAVNDANEKRRAIRGSHGRSAS